MQRERGRAYCYITVLKMNRQKYLLSLTQHWLSVLRKRLIGGVQIWNLRARKRTISRLRAVWFEKSRLGVRAALGYMVLMGCECAQVPWELHSSLDTADCDLNYQPLVESLILLNIFRRILTALQQFYCIPVAQIWMQSKLLWTEVQFLLQNA